MVRSASLYQYAEQQNIDVDWFPLVRADSLSIPLGDEIYGIAIDPKKIKSEADETVKLAHELGHCSTGAFYNRWATCDIRQKHEQCADKWAIKKLIPVDELDEAVAAGHTELWELADYFGVTEEFMKKAVCWYTHGNLAADLYFSTN